MNLIGHIGVGLELSALLGGAELQATTTHTTAAGSAARRIPFMVANKIRTS